MLITFRLREIKILGLFEIFLGVIVEVVEFLVYSGSSGARVLLGSLEAKSMINESDLTIMALIRMIK